jgi:hypothetical protein
MRSAANHTLPSSVRRSLAKLGGDIRVARLRRQLTVAMVCERMGGISNRTYVRVEKGDPAVALGIYAMALFVLGFGNAFGDVIDPRHDETGMLLDENHLPQRVRPPARR